VVGGEQQVKTSPFTRKNRPLQGPWRGGRERVKCTKDRVNLFQGGGGRAGKAA